MFIGLRLSSCRDYAQFLPVSKHRVRPCRCVSLIWPSQLWILSCQDEFDMVKAEFPVVHAA